ARMPNSRTSRPKRWSSCAICRASTAGAPPTGSMPSVDLNAWMGLLGPRALPEAIVQALNAHFNEILRMPEVQARMAT
ncbi:hypothetical protein FGX01_00285, partial [Xylella fastidiosa subsp. multiplex]|nr:hypothetical protein [Xylella fastidiosa subsp. multiplex]